MALPNSGPITMAMIAAEIGISASGLSLNDGRVRQLAGRPSGAISFADLLGKAWAYLNSISTTTQYGYRVILTGVDTNTSYTVSATVINGRYVTLDQRNATTWDLRPTRYDTSAYGTVRVSVTAAGKTLYKDHYLDVSEYSTSCFEAGCLVTMADGSHKAIEEVAVGDFVRTAVGISRVSDLWLPKLKNRTLYRMSDGKAGTSAEHCFWSRDPVTLEQWWATRDLDEYRIEAESGTGPNFDVDPFDLTHRESYWDFATENGWKRTNWYAVDADPETQLYHLLLDTGGSYFVDGYLVSSMASEYDVDWHKFTVE